MVRPRLDEMKIDTVVRFKVRAVDAVVTVCTRGNAPGSLSSLAKGTMSQRGSSTFLAAPMLCTWRARCGALSAANSLMLASSGTRASMFMCSGM